MNCLGFSTDDVAFCINVAANFNLNRLAVVSSGDGLSGIKVEVEARGQRRVAA